MRKFAAIPIGIGLLSSVFSAHAEIIDTKAEYAYILDFETGRTLFEKNSDILIPPASMSKLMTAYMVFDELDKGRLKLEDEFQISQKAFDRRGSSMFAQLKSEIAVDDLLKGIIVVSGNDAAIAVAEGIGGSEEQFAKQMQKKSREIGLTKSTFVNSTGWPDPNHLMSMHDLGQLAYRLIKDFPEHYHYFGQLKFKWGKVDQPNRNILLDDGIGVDGLKTGRTEESGYGIIASAIRNGKRVIVGINGMESARKRADETRRLIDWAFSDFRNYKLYDKGTVIGTAKVAGGEQSRVNMVVREDLIAYLNIDGLDELVGEVTHKSPLIAPLEANQEIGSLKLRGKAGFEYVVPLVAQKHVAKGSRVDHSIDIFGSWVDKKLDSLF